MEGSAALNGVVLGFYSFYKYLGSRWFSYLIWIDLIFFIIAFIIFFTYLRTLSYSAIKGDFVIFLIIFILSFFNFVVVLRDPILPSSLYFSQLIILCTTFFSFLIVISGWSFIPCKNNIGNKIGLCPRCKGFYAGLIILTLWYIIVKTLERTSSSVYTSKPSLLDTGLYIFLSILLITPTTVTGFIRRQQTDENKKSFNNPKFLFITGLFSSTSIACLIRALRGILG